MAKYHVIWKVRRTGSIFTNMFSDTIKARTFFNEFKCRKDVSNVQLKDGDTGEIISELDFDLLIDVFSVPKRNKKKEVDNRS